MAHPRALMLDMRLPIASCDRLRLSGPAAQRIKHRPTEPGPRQTATPCGRCSEVVSVSELQPPHEAAKSRWALCVFNYRSAVV